MSRPRRWLVDFFWATVLFCFFRVASGHSFLLKPRGDFTNFKKPECRIGGPPHSPNDNCPGPCISKNTWQYLRNVPVTTYSRGQMVSFTWTRNNHRGGFIRFSLVPEQMRMNRTAHDMMTFRYACFESDRHLCDVKNCGTDIWLYKTRVEIPTSLPDGDYILGWAWFGGLFDNSYFGDYYSCAPVKIQGGPLTKSYSPVFNPGEKVVDVNRATCRSAVDRVGVCVREPCLGYPGRRMRPYPYSQGRTPDPILQSWLKPGPPLLQPWPSTTPSPSASPSELPSPSPAPSPSASRPATNSKSSVSIVGLRMVDAVTNEVITGRFRHTIRIPPQVSGFSFVALTSGQVEVVKFYINGNWIRDEMYRPYACFGDDGGKLRPWRSPVFLKWFNLKIIVTGKDGDKEKKTFWVRLRPSTT